MATDTDLFAAVAAFAVARTPAKVAGLVRSGGRAALDQLADDMSAAGRETVAAEAAGLAEAGVEALILGEPGYPEWLGRLRRAPGVLFLKGQSKMLAEPSIGMCGSRKVSEAGLAAAKACGDEVASRDLAIVSGYAKGVDMATHMAALESGGRTVVVLAEGISRFRVKREFKAHYSEETVAVVSQFAPSQGWNVGAAMTRNAVIAGLSRALVVIEAGETGGTLDAGQQALRLPRPVLALEFASIETPAGNRILIDAGATSVKSRSELGRILDELAENEPPPDPVQLPML